MDSKTMSPKFKTITNLKFSKPFQSKLKLRPAITSYNSNEKPLNSTRNLNFNYEKPHNDINFNIFPKRNSLPYNIKEKMSSTDSKYNNKIKKPLFKALKSEKFDDLKFNLELSSKKFRLASHIIKRINFQTSESRNLLNIINLPTQINEALIHLKNKDFFFSLMNKIIEKTYESSNMELYLKTKKITAKLYFIYSDQHQSIRLNKQILIECEKYNFLRIKMSIYKRIAKIYLVQQNWHQSQKNLIKMLHLAWFLNSEQYECLAYDYLGLISFYQGEIGKATYFHNRMLNGEIEKNGSLAKNIAITTRKSKNNKKRDVFLKDELNNISSSDDNENMLNLNNDYFDNLQTENIKTNTQSQNFARFLRKTIPHLKIKEISGNISNNNIYFSHLSTNRSLSNFYCQKAQINNREKKEDYIKVSLTKKEEQKIINCLTFYKKNLVFAISFIKKINKVSFEKMTMSKDKIRREGLLS